MPTRLNLAFYRFLICAIAALFVLPRAHALIGQTDHSAPPAHLAEVWGLTPDKITHSYEVQQIASSVPANVLWRGDRAKLTFQFVNKTDKPLRARGKIEVIQYAVGTIGDDLFKYEMHRVGGKGAVAISVNIPPHGFQNVTVVPPIPARYGGYALIADLGAEGRHLATGCIRAMAQESRRVQYPILSLDSRPPVLLQRIGIHAVRWGVEYHPTTSPDFEQWMAERGRQLKELQAHNVTVLAMVLGGGPQPFDRMRSFLDDKDVGKMGYPGDGVWLPSADADFSKFCTRLAGTYGWPRGPVTALELWNEPWEGSSISGWGADLPRYREIYSAMWDGVHAARLRGADVLVGGCDSSSNALDKLFSDGKKTFLPKFDFVSLHYQGLSCPINVPLWRDRKGGTGRVKMWDTESWAANTDERVLPRLASWRAAGYDRLMGVDASNVCDDFDVEVRHTNAPPTRIHTIQSWSVGASVAALANLLGNRPFQNFVFRNGLPWVMQFGGIRNPDDGTLVVTGNIGAKTNSIFRTVRLSPGARMVLPASADYLLLDYYGNPIPAQNGRLIVPLGTDGYYLRASGRAGTFAKLVNAVRAARIEGIDPVEIVAKDMTAPLREKPMVALRLTNVLNRPVTGKVSVTLGMLILGGGKNSQTITLKPNETRTVQFRITGGREVESNGYRLAALFDAGRDGTVRHNEVLHCNVIARRTIAVNGDLSDWKGVLPQTISDPGSQQPNLTEQAWYPYKSFDAKIKKGFGTGYLACDNKYFYFAARIADSTPDPGTLRFATRDDDQFFYPGRAYTPSRASASFSVRWTGQLIPTVTGLYTLSTVSDDGIRLWLDGKMLIDNWTDHGATENTATVELTAGKRYDLKIEYYQGTGGAVARLRWEPPHQERVTIPTACLAASDTDTPGTGLTGTYFTGTGLSNNVLTRSDKTVDFEWQPGEMPFPKPGNSALEALDWPTGVRRYTYRKDPILPAGNGQGNFDNIQIAFNVIPESDVRAKGAYPFAPGTMPHFSTYRDTDYEYALNAVAPQYGGGTEIVRLLVPGMPRKHFYPREPQSPYDGVVKSGKLVMRRSGNTRIVECAIPWTELPLVKKRLDAGQTIKFTFRVNDNNGPAYELAHDRSVSTTNGQTFHCDWVTHWSNELEFGSAR